MSYLELGKYPVRVYIKSRMLNYWLKLINGKQSKRSHNVPVSFENA